jgi:hypothetical protein
MMTDNTYTTNVGGKTGAKQEEDDKNTVQTIMENNDEYSAKVTIERMYTEDNSYKINPTIKHYVPNGMMLRKNWCRRSQLKGVNSIANISKITVPHEGEKNIDEIEYDMQENNKLQEIIDNISQLIDIELKNRKIFSLNETTNKYLYQNEYDINNFNSNDDLTAMKPIKIGDNLKQVSQNNRSMVEYPYNKYRQNEWNNKKEQYDYNIYENNKLQEIIDHGSDLVSIQLTKSTTATLDEDTIDILDEIEFNNNENNILQEIMDAMTKENDTLMPILTPAFLFEKKQAKGCIKSETINQTRKGYHQYQSQKDIKSQKKINNKVPYVTNNNLTNLTMGAKIQKMTITPSNSGSIEDTSSIKLVSTAYVHPIPINNADAFLNKINKGLDKKKCNAKPIDGKKVTPFLNAPNTNISTSMHNQIRYKNKSSPKNSMYWYMLRYMLDVDYGKKYKFKQKLYRKNESRKARKEYLRPP